MTRQKEPFSRLPVCINTCSFYLRIERNHTEQRRTNRDALEAIGFRLFKQSTAYENVAFSFVQVFNYARIYFPPINYWLDANFIEIFWLTIEQIKWKTTKIDTIYNIILPQLYAAKILANTIWFLSNIILYILT